MGLTKLKTGAAIAFVIFLLAFAVRQGQQAKRLAADNAALREQLEQLTTIARRKPAPGQPIENRDPGR
jgi:hypothetical protein